MQTECPHCHTIFRLTETLLEAANGKVRCSQCHTVFSAVPSPEKIEEPTDTPEVIRSDENAPNTRDENVLFADDDLLHSVVPEDIRQSSLSNSTPILNTAIWSIGILALIATLLFQIVWFNRDRFVKLPQYHDAIVQFCSKTGCDLQPVHIPEKIEMLSRNVYSHPNEKEALMVSVTIVNRATFSQSYPDLDIKFSNIRGELVARRIFTPDEYLSSSKPHSVELEPDQPITFGIALRDPGKQAMTYEFDFL